MTDTHHLANAIRQARKQTGLSQEELAAQLGIRQSSISQWERGTTLPSTRHLLGLLAALGQPFASILVDLAATQVTRVPDSQASPESNVTALPRPQTHRAYGLGVADGSRPAPR